MLARMTSQELTGWFVLFTVKGEEAERQRHGRVHDHASDEDEPDEVEPISPEELEVEL